MSHERLSEVSEILPHLYISDWDSSQDPGKLQQNNIRAILTAEMEPKSRHIQAGYLSAGIDFMQIAVDDTLSADIAQFFDSTYDFINKHIEGNENVLVHCRAGVSRSVTIVINYLVRRLYKQAKDQGAVIDPAQAVAKALDLVRSRRPAANPNPSFMKQLVAKAEEYSKSCVKSNLNFISVDQRMGDKSFVDASGKPANIIQLSNDDFDANGNLVNFKDVVGVVFWQASWCGHCQHTKPEYIKFANSIPPGAPVRAFSVDAVKNKDLVARISPATWGYSVKGFPAIVGYAGGKFYSEYGMDDPKTFRTANDFILYAQGLGKAPVETVPS